MSGRILVLAIILLLIPALATADPLVARGEAVLHGGPGTIAKAEVDTINLMSTHSDPTNGPGEPAYYGDFEDLSGWSPDWNGWTSVDLSLADYGETHWQASDYRRLNGDFSAYCGDPDQPSCNYLDTLGGYGANYDERLEWRQFVTDPALPCTVTVEAILNVDVMPGYDYCILSVQTGIQTLTDIWSYDGLVNGYHLQETFVYQPADFTGDAGNEVVLQFRVTSDGGWDNEDCLWEGSGAMQVDDVTVTLSQGGVTTFDDFEDGTLGNWIDIGPPGVGDFAQLWMGLEDYDPCHSNYSTQVAFLDDGLVVPGTGGSECINWCYGPNGYIVNTTGGLVGPHEHIHNGIESPVMTWPNDSYHGILLNFGVFRHEDLSNDAPGQFYTYAVRSADTDGSAGHGMQVLADQPWRDRGFVYYGDPEYIRESDDVTDLMNPGRDVVQVQAAVYELGWKWGWVGNDGYPAPYFDDFTVKVFDKVGPAMTAKVADLAQDAFPANGTHESVDPSVRFDMARNVADSRYSSIDPGDSVVVNVAPLGVGASISPAPRMEYTLQANPAFDHLRSAGMPDAGYVAGAEILDPGDGTPTGEWAFDLPDTGFLMPGDVLHYLFVATQTGPEGTIQNFLPADTTGFHDFSGKLTYDEDFTMRALPGVIDPLAKTVITTGGPALLWFDATDLSGLESWVAALDAFAVEKETSTFDYDLYRTRAPGSNVGNGLASRVTPAQLDHYGTILYSSGTEPAYTLITDQGPLYDDPGLLTNWLGGEEKHLLLTGDNLVSDLVDDGSGFPISVMGVSHQTDFLRSFIDNQVAPRVVSIPSAGLFQEIPSWIAYGGCVGINKFDGVIAQNGGIAAAEFTDQAGLTGAYPFAAATINPLDDDLVISLPYDLMFVYTDPSAPPLFEPARQSLVGDVLRAFMYMWDIVGDVPDQRLKLAAAASPNPFNPRVTIDYTVPAPGRLSVKIFDVRGALVRTVMDEKVQTAGKAIWDGRDDRGGEAASGVYFYEVRLGGDVEIGKMALVR